MEQQKVLWIIFSVALFVLIVVGVGFIWFFPQDGGLAQAASVEGKGKSEGEGKTSEKEFDPIEWVKTSGEYPELTPSEDEEEKEEGEDFVIVYGEDEESKGDGSTPSAEGAQGKEGGKLPEYEGTEEKDAGKADTPAAKTGEEGKPSTPKPTVHKKPSTAVAEKTPPKEVTVKEYWIQAGSYKSKTRAVNVKEELAARGVESRLTSREIDGTTYFRVRIGPYEAEGEAEKFLAWIKEVQGFESSYVSMVYAKRRLN